MRSTLLLSLALPAPVLAALALLPACLPDEKGIDRTVLTGTITIPPLLIEDVRTNSVFSAAQPLGGESKSLTWRSVVVNGRVSEWVPDPETDAIYGDADYYAFAPVADGTFTFDLSFVTTPAPPADTGADTAPADTAPADTGDTGDTAAPAPVSTIDADVIVVELIDPATYDPATGAGVLLTTTTDGSGGAFSFSYDVTAGTNYVLLLAGSVTDAPAEDVAYTLVVNGSAPTDSTILVGAYLGADPQIAEDPAGGTTAMGWVYDAATYTWNASYKIMWLRTVTAPGPDEDTGDEFEPTSTVEEGPSTVYLRAGSLTSLNASPAAGALYTTASVEASATGETTEVTTPLVLDGVFPKVVGQQVSETLPDVTVAELDLADYSLVEETLVAQELGMLSGLGYVDIVSGSSVLDPAYSGWNGTNDSDAFAFTVPESMYVRMVAGWTDAAADIDFGIWYADPEYGIIDLFSSFGDSYCLTGANPEVCESVVTLEPDVTYYLLALGYLGTDEQPYTVELEWVAP